MRKSTHSQFLENWVSDSVVPKGLKTAIKSAREENPRLQKVMGKILRKTSIETTGIASDEHYLQLQESKPKMTELKEKSWERI